MLAKSMLKWNWSWNSTEWLNLLQHFEAFRFAYAFSPRDLLLNVVEDGDHIP
jgi:hypothetical protein